MAASPAYQAVGLYEQWEAEFKPLLGATPRWEGFCYIVRDLLERPAPVIVEVGGLRQPGNWKGDGQSTRLWYWIREHKPGYVASVDTDPNVCELTMRECPGLVNAVCWDSVAFLRGFMPFALDLLYLDSSDSPWQQVAELAAIYERLPSGCLIASDDAKTKAVLSRKLLPEPILDGHIVVWKKP